LTESQAGSQLDSRFRGNDKRVAIVYLSFHSELYLERAFVAWKNLNYPQDKLTVVIVDNPHPNYGNSREFIRRAIAVENADLRSLPSIVFLPQEKNLGFAAGENMGVKWAIANDYDYVYFHNQDGFLAPNGILKAVETMESNKYIGAAQSLIMLYPEQDLINSSGNKFHYLGFGYCGEYRKRICHPVSQRDPFGKNEDLRSESADSRLRGNDSIEIGYASGAGMMARVDLLRQWGGFDEDYFAYHEDVEYSLRLKALGYKVVLAPESIFYHEYEFSRNPGKYYLMERNRLGLMITYFKWGTLILFLPVKLILEFGLLGFALKNGWAKEWLKARSYWLKMDNWKKWLRKRDLVQKTRKVKDSKLLETATGKVVFDGVSGWLVGLGNIVLNGYWRVIYPIIKIFN